MTSEWKERAIVRRDERHTKVADDTQKPKAGKKNTKKWCKGKQGREHTLVCMTYDEAKGTTNIKGFQGWRYLVCTSCGKEMDVYIPRFFESDPTRPKPDWVIK